MSQASALSALGVSCTFDRLLARLHIDKEEPLLVRINAHADAPVRHLLRFVTALEGLAKGDVVLVVTPKVR